MPVLAELDDLGASTCPFESSLPPENIATEGTEVKVIWLSNKQFSVPSHGMRYSGSFDAEQ